MFAQTVGSDTFLDRMTSPDFWFTAVIVGLVINVIGAFVFRGLEGLFNRRSAVTRARTQAREAELESQVNNLLTDPSKVTDLKIDMIYQMLRIILVLAVYLIVQNLVFAVPFYAFEGGEFVQPVLMFLSSSLAIALFSRVWRAQGYNRQILQEYNRRREAEIKIQTDNG